MNPLVLTLTGPRHVQNHFCYLKFVSYAFDPFHHVIGRSLVRIDDQTGTLEDTQGTLQREPSAGGFLQQLRCRSRLPFFRVAPVNDELQVAVTDVPGGSLWSDFGGRLDEQGVMIQEG